MREIFHFNFNIRVLFNLFDESFMVIEMCNSPKYLLGEKKRIWRRKFARISQARRPGISNYIRLILLRTIISAKYPVFVTSQ